MKTLLLVRHAKSGAAENLQTDFDRILNARGNKEAFEMGKRLNDKKISIDTFISSPAKRALITCEYFIKAFKRKTNEIIKIKKLYEATVEDFFKVIKHIDNNYNSVAIFGHNPTITAFANEMFCLKIDDMPTCSVFGVTSKIQDWQDFQQAEKEFLLFEYPKNIH